MKRAGGVALRWLYANFAKKLFSALIIALPIIIILIGIASLAAGYFFTDGQTSIFLKSIGAVFTTSGIFSSLLKVMQVTRYFQDSIHDVVFGSRFLCERKDLHDVWKRVSLALAETKGAAIDSEVIENVFKKFFHGAPKYRHEDYIREVDLCDFDETEGVVTLKSRVSYTLKPCGDESVEFSFKTRTSEHNRSDITSFFIGDVDYKDKVSPPVYDPSTKYNVQYLSAKIPPGPPVPICRTEDEALRLDARPFKKFTTITYVRGGKVIVRNHMGNKLNPILIPVGVGEDFFRDADEAKMLRERRPGDLHKVFDGLLMPGQGYILMISRL